ncbi:MAG: trypsin-like peptidase domain-containing protein [Candidatus Cloacimonetes bacterium]|jgi:serine protease Do|nr:trypsin-like peptidase domain-containing protein [Candidatus Cloacimonadota bacterium]MDD4156647.1 trypsin-like peptidase domain-containing protein [Candidatus Cloacimonadota bacterium]
MKKTGCILTVLLIVFINLCMFFIYDQYFSRQNALSLLTQSTDKIIETDKESIISSLNENRQTAITKAVAIIEPTVVSVNVLKTEIIRRNTFFDDFFSDFFGAPLKREIQSIGSGVIFTADGYIITNAHVVEGATQIKVVLNDTREYDSDLIGIDSIHDIAIIKINGNNLPFAKLGGSSDLIIGEWAIAVGNPYGFLMKDSKPSVSVGVISALNRNFTNSQENKVFKGMIQTDAAINPGNSGGPLVNINGEIIGINSFIFTETGGSIGIGFAIPIDQVKKISEELISFGKVREAYFGFKIQDITPLMASYLKLKNLDGVIISSVEPNGPAHQAGLKRGDIIVNINSLDINNSSDAELAVSDVSPGDNVMINILRDNKNVSIILIAGEYR